MQWKLLNNEKVYAGAILIGMMEKKMETSI